MKSPHGAAENGSVEVNEASAGNDGSSGSGGLLPFQQSNTGVAIGERSINGNGNIAALSQLYLSGAAGNLAFNAQQFGAAASSLGGATNDATPVLPSTTAEQQPLSYGNMVLNGTTVARQYQQADVQVCNDSAPSHNPQQHQFRDLELMSAQTSSAGLSVFGTATAPQASPVVGSPMFALQSAAVADLLSQAAHRQPRPMMVPMAAAAAAAAAAQNAAVSGNTGASASLLISTNPLVAPVGQVIPGLFLPTAGAGQNPMIGTSGTMGVCGSLQQQQQPQMNSSLLMSSAQSLVASVTSAQQAAANNNNNPPAAPLTAHGKVLSMDQDTYELSPYQCLVRKQIEIFQQPRSLLQNEVTTQGRNRPVVPGQVGIRCRHCGTADRKYRSKYAVLFPSQLLGVYQAAQNMANTHLLKTCKLIPEDTRKQLLKKRTREKGQKTCKSAYGGGRQYWADTLQVLGVVEGGDRRLRFVPCPPEYQGNAAAAAAGMGQLALPGAGAGHFYPYPPPPPGGHHHPSQQG